MKETIVIAGSLAQKPWHGGHTWVFLQYLLGFKKLGWNVLFLDRLEPEMCIDAQGRPCALEKSANLEYFTQVMQDFDLSDSCALLYDEGEVAGMTRESLLHKIDEAALMLNVMGFIQDEDILSRAQKRVFLDIDPGFGQMWQELGLCEMFTDHDFYVTIGENIGKQGCTVPTCGVKWIPSRQPVQLDYWKPNGNGHGRTFTTIASWRGTYGPIEFNGETFGLRVHEFRKLVSLPRSTGEHFEIALEIDSADHADKHLLESNNWTLITPRNISSDPHQYQRFIQDSGAEFMVAKNIYVQTRGGWFSDRSTCYLASGKPVLAQDTGLSSLYPIGQGLLTFESLDEAIDNVREIRRNYDAHARAARAIAVEYFDSNKVLRSLLDKVA